MGRSGRPAGGSSAAVLALMLAAASGMAGCSSEQPTPPAGASQPCAPCSCAPAGVVDVSLLAFLSKARAAHHQADISEQAGESAEAIRPLERLVGEALPGAGGAKPAPEVREVLADTYARLAELRSGLGQFAAAHADLERGLRLAAERTHFRGRLMEVRGLVEERHAKKLAADGDDAGALAANGRAVAAFEQAIEIQADVIEQTLADAGAAPGPGVGDSGPLDRGANP